MRSSRRHLPLQSFGFPNPKARGAMTSWKKTTNVLMMTGLALLAGCGSGSDDDTPPPAPPVASAPLDLTILHVNEHHSTLDSKTKTLQPEDAAGKDTALGVASGRTEQERRRKGWGSTVESRGAQCT